MRILLLSQWYPPEPAKLLQELAQSLQTNGHDVTVLTGFPNYPSGNLYPGYRLKLWQRETLSGIDLVRVPLYPNHSRSGFLRIINYFSFALSSSLLGFWLIGRPDVIFVYHPPLTIGIPAYVLSRLWRVPFVYQVQDMWPETLQATGMVNNEHVIDWVGHFARWVYQRANGILVISPGFRENLLAKRVPPKKIRVISNWIDSDSYYPESPNSVRAAQLGLAGRFNIMYAGNVGAAQGLETIIRVAELLTDIPQIQFVIVGDGVALPSLRQVVQERGLENVKFLGRYPEEEMPVVYSLADVLLVHLKDDPLFRITIPHKIFAYMANSKPILAAIAGDATDVILDAGAGLACSPENPDELAKTVRQFFAMSSSERAEMGRLGLKAVQTKYDRESLVKEIEVVLQAVVDEKKKQGS